MRPCLAGMSSSERVETAVERAPADLARRGRAEIRRVAVSSGGGGSDLIRAAHEGYDALSRARPRSRAGHGPRARDPPDRGRPPRHGALRRQALARTSRGAIRARVALPRGRESDLKVVAMPMRTGRRRACATVGRGRLCRPEGQRCVTVQALKKGLAGTCFSLRVMEYPRSNHDRFREAGPLTPARNRTSADRARANTSVPSAGFFVTREEDTSRWRIT